MRVLPGTLSHFRVQEKLGCVLAALDFMEEKQSASIYLFPLHVLQNVWMQHGNNVISWGPLWENSGISGEGDLPPGTGGFWSNFQLSPCSGTV